MDIIVPRFKQDGGEEEGHSGRRRSTGEHGCVLFSASQFIVFVIVVDTKAHLSPQKR